MLCGRRISRHSMEQGRHRAWPAHPGSGDSPRWGPPGPTGGRSLQAPAGMPGRPGRCGWVQRRRTRSRCQRSRLSGSTKNLPRRRRPILRCCAEPNGAIVRIPTKAGLEKRQSNGSVSSSGAVPRKSCSGQPDDIFDIHTWAKPVPTPLLSISPSLFMQSILENPYSTDG